jgi:hypothetical protein
MTRMSLLERRPTLGRCALVCAGLSLAICSGSGCARSKCCGTSASAGQPYSPPLTATERGIVSPDVSAVRSYTELEPPGISQTLLEAPAHYQSLTAEECRARAAKHAVLANLLDAERDAISSSACVDPCGTELRSDLLALRAEDERNRAAGTALELFFRLAEAEAGRDSVRRSLSHVEQSLNDIAELRRQGLPINVDATALERQRLELRERGELAARSLSELNLQLSRLIGIDADMPAPIWPVIEWRVEYAAIDVEEAIRVGLATRADLAIVRRLDGSLGPGTLPAARGTLMQVDPMLGQPSVPTGRLLGLRGGAPNDGAEAASRQGQVSLLRADRERATADEIRQAAFTVQSRYREIALAKDTLTSWNGRLSDLRKRREAGNVNPFEIRAAEAEIVAAENELIGRVVAWKISQVKLEQAQGLLSQPLASAASLPLE